MDQKREPRKSFAHAAQPFVKIGIPETELLPVIPHDAKLSPRSKVTPENRGKVPGRYLQDGTWAGLSDWQNETPRAANWPTSNVGLRSSLFPAVDIDVRSQAARELVESHLVWTLGLSGPTRVREGSPRCLMVFRQKPGLEPVRKLRLGFKLKGDRDTHVVEILGHGQQYLIAGTHPSGTAYEWMPGEDLRKLTNTEELMPVSGDDMHEAMESLRDLIVSQGGKIVEQTKAGALTDGVKLADIKSDMDPALVLEALRAIPNTPDVLPSRDDLVVVLSAFKANLGARSEEFRADACEWATEHGWADTNYFDKVWESIKTVRVGAHRLFDKARGQGWHGDIEHDFPPLPEGDAKLMENEVAKTEQRETKKLEDVAAKLVFWNGGQRWFVRGEPDPMSNDQFNTHPLALTLAPAGTSGVKRASSILLNSGLVQRVSGVSYAPGKPELFEWDFSEEHKGKFYNRWRPGRTLLTRPVKDSEIQEFLGHVAAMFPDDEEREVFLDWMAHIIQHPGKKTRWAPIIIGAQGIGKDMMLKPLSWALAQNAVEISPTALEEKWTGWYERQLVIVQEMDRREKAATYERIKAAVSGTNAGLLVVEKKYQEPYPVPDSLAFVFLTNHDDAFSISNDDRRFLVLKCAVKRPFPADYYAAMADFYAKDGLRKVASWLAQRSLANFNSDAAPLYTKAKEDMWREALNDWKRYVHDTAREDRGIFEGRTVLATDEILKSIMSDTTVARHVRERMNAKQIAGGMENTEWVKYHRQVPDERNVMRNVYVRGKQPEGFDMLRQKFIREKTGAADFPDDVKEGRVLPFEKKE